MFGGHAHVAQAAEHLLGKEKVPGSNPGVGSNRPNFDSIRHSTAIGAFYKSRFPLAFGARFGAA